MTLSLTPAEAETKITQVDETMIEVRRLANRILDSTQTMTASSWQGGRAQMFRAHHDAAPRGLQQRHQQALQQVADKGK